MSPRRRRTAGVSRAAGPLYDRSTLAARLRQQQRAWLSRLNRPETLLDMVRAVHATHEPSDIAHAVVHRASTWIPLTCWAVVCADHQEQLSVIAEAGIAPDFGPALYGVADWVISHQEVFLSGDLRHEARVSVDQPTAVIAWPLKGRNQVAGVLVGLDRAVSAAAPSLTKGVASAVEALLTPAGFALHTAMLLRRSEALSVTDDLTRLYNARYLNIALRRETRLAVRNNRPLSLLFIDLDGFKSINDSHGHLAGSRALVEAGAVIRGSARETDIVARFGGDEFALILPDTGSGGALAVAERIRERIARHGFLAGDGLDIHLTASVGVATLPDVAVAADELVQAADAAMYRVKDRGKNGIHVAVSSR